jgi:hypothetical protein
LKKQNVPVLLSLNFPKRTAAASPEADAESLEILRLRAETPKTAGRLAQAGIKFAFSIGRNDEHQRLFNERHQAVRKRFGERRGDPGDDFIFGGNLRR